jgi:hypothetical protein
VSVRSVTFVQSDQRRFLQQGTTIELGKLIVQDSKVLERVSIVNDFRAVNDVQNDLRPLCMLQELMAKSLVQVSSLNNAR